MNPFVIAFRRIIYSIPLKRLLLGLAVFAVLFASFSSATSINLTVYEGQDNFIRKSDYGNPEIICFSNVNRCSQVVYTIGVDGTYSNSTYFNQYMTVGSSDVLNYVCTIEGDGFDVVPLAGSSCEISVYYPTNFTSLQCQTEYNLIPISSVDQNYCTTNNLCPAGGTPSDCPNVGVSNLYINDIFHPGAFNIIMNIPEEIEWDYAYTNSGSNFNLDVVGYNQDFEKIEGWIETNNYKPTASDFTNIFTGGFSNFGGLLIATLFVILVFYFVKKMFK